MKFLSINYLEQGNERQQALYKVLKTSKLMEQLAAFNPIIAGSIPIEIDIPSSDVLVLLNSTNCEAEKEKIAHVLCKYSAFESFQKSTSNILFQFEIDSFHFEVHCSNIPTQKQPAYTNMLLEHALLQSKGEDFRKKIIYLKNQGNKTQTAFRKALRTNEDPYQAIQSVESSLN